MKKTVWKVITFILVLIIAFGLICALWYLNNLDVSVKEHEKLSDEAESMDDDTDEAWKNVVIDFDYLLGVNPDVIGWIRFDNTDVINIDYPILYSSESELKYLKKSVYGTYSVSGSIFLESMCSPDFSDAYSILYGHNMRNGTMFGSLKKYRIDNSVYDENQYFTIYTPTEAIRYQIFAYFVTTDGSFAYQVGFLHDELYEQLLEEIQESSMINPDIEVTKDDTVMTLSTCCGISGTKKRFVVFGKVIDTFTYSS